MEKLRREALKLFVSRWKPGRGGAVRVAGDVTGTSPSPAWSSRESNSQRCSCPTPCSGQSSRIRGGAGAGKAAPSPELMCPTLGSSGSWNQESPFPFPFPSSSCAPRARCTTIVSPVSCFPRDKPILKCFPSILGQWGSHFGPL